MKISLEIIFLKETESNSLFTYELIFDDDYSLYFLGLLLRIKYCRT